MILIHKIKQKFSEVNTFGFVIQVVYISKTQCVTSYN